MANTSGREIQKLWQKRNSTKRWEIINFNGRGCHCLVVASSFKRTVPKNRMPFNSGVRANFPSKGKDTKWNSTRVTIKVRHIYDSIGVKSWLASRGMQTLLGRILAISLANYEEDSTCGDSFLSQSTFDTYAVYDGAFIQLSN